MDFQKSDGMNYAPSGKPAPVCAKGDFPVAACRLDHGHIYGMCKGLVEAGAEIKIVYDPDPAKVEAFIRAFPAARAASCEEEALEDDEVRLVAGAAVTSERCALGIRAMESGKHYFTDKAPLVSLDQLSAAKDAVARTGRKYAVYYSERIHVESAVYAGKLIEDGAIGKVLQVVGFGPHRLSAPSRPDWFFRRASYGGILCDIGSHQIEQYLHFAGERDAAVAMSHVANYAHPEHPELEDFGEAMLVGTGGSSNYFRVDWFTPDGLGSWGDGRTIILGAKGYIELRKYIDIGRDKAGDHVYLANGDGEYHFAVGGQVGFPFFGQLILDCLEGTERAMTQEHAFKAAELCVRAQSQALRISPPPGA